MSQLEPINSKDVFYRDRYRHTIHLIIVMSSLALILTAILIGFLITVPKPRYYATTRTGQVVPMHSLSEPVITNDYLLQWSSLATREAFNLDFVNYNTQLDRAKSRFTSSGWSRFMAAMKKSGLLDTVIDKKLEISAVVSKPPIILNTAVVHGHFTWRVQLPILVTFTSASETRQSHWLVTMNVRRISTLDAYQGIQINDFTASRNV